MLEPTSGLFWWSAETISTFMPLRGGAEVLDRHLRGEHRALAGDVGIQARHVVHDADLDHVVGNLRLRSRRATRNGGQRASYQHSR